MPPCHAKPGLSKPQRDFLLSQDFEVYQSKRKADRVKSPPTKSTPDDFQLWNRKVLPTRFHVSIRPNSAYSLNLQPGKFSVFHDVPLWEPSAEPRPGPVYLWANGNEVENTICGMDVSNQHQFFLWGTQKPTSLAVKNPTSILLNLLGDFGVTKIWSCPANYPPWWTKYTSRGTSSLCSSMRCCSMDFAPRKDSIKYFTMTIA